MKYKQLSSEQFSIAEHIVSFDQVVDYIASIRSDRCIMDRSQPVFTGEAARCRTFNSSQEAIGIPDGVQPLMAVVHWFPSNTLLYGQVLSFAKYIRRSHGKRIFPPSFLPYNLPNRASSFVPNVRKSLEHKVRIQFHLIE